MRNTQTRSQMILAAATKVLEKVEEIEARAQVSSKGLSVSVLDHKF